MYSLNNKTRGMMMIIVVAASLLTKEAEATSVSSTDLLNKFRVETKATSEILALIDAELDAERAAAGSSSPTLTEGEYIISTPEGLGLGLMTYADSNIADNFRIKVLEGHDIDVSEVTTEKATGSIWGKTTGGWAKLYDCQTGMYNAKTRSQIKAEEAARKHAEAEEARKQAEETRKAEEARTERFWGKLNRGITWTSEITGNNMPHNHTFKYEKVAMVPVPAGVASVSKKVEQNVEWPLRGQTVSVAPPATVTRRRLCDSPVLAALMAEIAAQQ